MSYLKVEIKHPEHGLVKKIHDCDKIIFLQHRIVRGINTFFIQTDKDGVEYFLDGTTSIETDHDEYSNFIKENMVKPLKALRKPVKNARRTQVKKTAKNKKKKT